VSVQRTAGAQTHGPQDPACAETDAPGRRWPSVRELKAICRKGDLDPFWISNIFWRPVSIYVTWLLIRLGARSNQVTFISALLAVAGSLVLLLPSDATLIASVVLTQAFFLLDHVDGEIARFRARPPAQVEDHSGRYFDVLVHYFQGPSLYYCLGAGLALADGDPRWAILGALGGVAGSGFPRLVAAWTLLPVASTRSDAAFRRFAAHASQFNAAYWKPEERPQRFFVVPRTRVELVFAAKQYIGFPGNLFAFAAAALLDVLVPGDGGFLFVKLFLTFYTAVLVANLVFLTRRHLQRLSAVPRPTEADSPSSVPREEPATTTDVDRR
jgi:hypothetical protein